MGSSLSITRLRTPVPGDAPALGRMHAQAWREAYGHLVPPDRLGEDFEAKRIESWRALLDGSNGESSGAQLALAERDGRVLGFAGFGPARDPQMPREHELWFVYLLSEAHGTGLAQRLVRAVDPEQLPAYLWVFCDNPRAMAFYRRISFEIYGDAVSMKTLTDRQGTKLREIRMVR